MSILLPSPRYSQPDISPAVGQANPLSIGLLASFPMVAGGRLYDASKNVNHSNQINFNNTFWSSGSSGTQLKFNGSQADGSVSWGDVGWFNSVTGSLTFEIEFFLPSLPSAGTVGTLIGKYNTGTDGSFTISVNENGRIQFYFLLSTIIFQTWRSNDFVISAGSTYHVVFSWRNSNNASWYLNGKNMPFGTTPAPTNNGMITTTAPFQFGRIVSGDNLTGSIGMVNIWRRALTDAEAYSRYINRWSMFAAPKGISVSVSSVTYTYARPSSDVTTQWTPSSGTSHFALIDEVTYNDADYIYATAAAQTDEVGLQAMSIPTAGTDVLINYRVQGITGGGSVTVSLYSGATLVKTDTTRTANNTSPPYYTMTVTPAEWASVSNWSNMRLRFVSA